jgi:hypothetical protein
LNLPQLVSGPLSVARSGKTSDFRCSSWTKSTPLFSGVVVCDAGWDCEVAEGASGAAPVWLCCATLAAHRKQQLAVIKIRRCLQGKRLSPITRVVNIILGSFPSGKTKTTPYRVAAPIPSGWLTIQGVLDSPPPPNTRSEVAARADARRRSLGSKTPSADLIDHRTYLEQSGAPSDFSNTHRPFHSNFDCFRFGSHPAHSSVIER